MDFVNASSRCCTRSHLTNNGLSPYVIILPILVEMSILTTSQIHCAYHNIDHWQDVLVGSILGLVMSFFAHRQYYPPLSSPNAHHPFSPRIKREGGERGPGAGGESSSSDDSHAPILPFVRPGLGVRHSNSLRESQKGSQNVGGSGSGPGSGHNVGSRRSGSGSVVEGGRGSEELLTHPAQPHIHVHSTHTHAHPYTGVEYTYPQYGPYRDEESTGVNAEDLQRSWHIYSDPYIAQQALRWSRLSDISHERITSWRLCADPP